MAKARDRIRRWALLTSTVGLVIAAVALGSEGPSLATEDPFAAMGVQRPANPGPAPDLELPNLDGSKVHIKDFRGKVVLLGFFSTT